MQREQAELTDIVIILGIISLCVLAAVYLAERRQHAPRLAFRKRRT